MQPLRPRTDAVELGLLGNQVAHSEEVVITKDDALRYRRLADKVNLQLTVAEMAT